MKKNCANCRYSKILFQYYYCTARINEISKHAEDSCDLWGKILDNDNEDNNENTMYWDDDI